MGYFLSVLGAFLILEGIPYLAFPGKVKQWSLALQDNSNKALRIIGIASLGAGMLILFFSMYF